MPTNRFRPLLLALLLTAGARAQNAANYAFTKTATASLAADANGNAIVLPATNLIPNNTNAVNADLVPIGFEFYFMGKPYTHFIAGHDGQIGLALAGAPAAILGTTNTNFMLRTVAYPPVAANTAPVLAAFWDDLKTPASGPTVRTVVSGTAPNRCCIIDFTLRINQSSTSSTGDGRFQIRLYEGTGVFEYVYGNMSIGTSSATVTASIGFSAGATDGSFLALQDPAGNGVTTLASGEFPTRSLVNSAVVGPIAALHSTADGARRSFRFAPPQLAGTPLTLTAGNIGTTALTLNWQDTYTNEFGYGVFRSTDGVNFTQVGTTAANGTSYTATGLTAGITYTWKVQALSEGGAGPAATLVASPACFMSGTYTVGGSGSTFPTLKAALDTLRFKGMAGNVVFQLEPGYSTAAETFPVTPPKDAQMPCRGNNRLTIRAGSAPLVLSSPASTAFFLLDSCSYVTIDGSPNGSGSTLALSLSNSGNAPVIQFSNASRNIVRYVAISGGASTSPLVLLRGTVAGGCDSNRIERCRFSAPAADARAVLVSAIRTGTITNDRDSVIDCSFSNFSAYALQAGAGSNGWVVSGNSFFNTGNISYAPDAGAIRFEEGSNAVAHRVTDNNFGGTADGASGNAMTIDHKRNFFFVDMIGNAVISNNRFRRIRFDNSSSNSNAAAAGIRTGYGTFATSFNGTVSDNSFGGPAAADSIHATQRFAGNKLTFAGVFYGDWSGGEITGNSFAGIRAYSPDASVTLAPIYLQNAGAYIRNNQVGHAAVINSIINYSDGPTYGIFVNNGSGVITGNTVTRITGASPGSNATVRGIHLGGSLDSIYNNEVSYLSASVSDNPETGLIGILHTNNSTNVYNASITANKVYNLHNAGQHADPSASKRVAGIFTNSNIAIRRNFIHSLTCNSTTGLNNISGIHFSEFDGIVENNMVRLGYDSLGQPDGGPVGYIGIYMGYVIFHNTVVIGGNYSASTSSLASSSCFFWMNSAQAPFLYNNIFVNTRHNTAVNYDRHYCINAHGIPVSENNVLFTGGNSDGYVGTSAFTPYQTLAQWRTATGRDLASISADPKLVNPYGPSASADLHLLAGSPAESAGNTYTQVMVDYDDQERNSLTPVDIGADAGNYQCVSGSAPGLSLTGGSNTCSINPPVLHSSASTGNQWYVDGVLLNGVTGSTYTPMQPGSYSVAVMQNGCTTPRSAAIVIGGYQQVSVPTVSASPSGALCSGSAVTLTATAANCSGCIYKWSTGVRGTSNSIVVTTPGIYSVMVGNGCDSVTVNYALQMDPPVTPSVSIAASACNAGSVTFTATQTNGGSSPQVQWFVNGVAAGSGLTHTVSNVPAGTQVYARLTSNAACASPQVVNSATLTVNCISTAVATIDGVEHITVGPNPARRALGLSLRLTHNKQVGLTLTDISGRTVYTASYRGLAGNNRWMIPVNTLAGGTYLLTLRIGGQVQTETIVVAH